MSVVPQATVLERRPLGAPVKRGGPLKRSKGLARGSGRLKGAEPPKRFRPARCVHCDAPFESRRCPLGWTKYCSHACAGAAKRRTVQKTCPICGIVWETRPCEAKKKQTCSRKCGRELYARRERLPKAVIDERRRERIARKGKRCARPGCGGIVTYHLATYCSAACHYADRPRVRKSRRNRARGAQRTAWREDTLTCVRCGASGIERHHAIYEQHVVREDPEQRYNVANRVGLCVAHHKAHHARINVLPLAALPDSVYAFAAELLGAPRAYEYLRRRYAGGDVRLDALLV